MVVMVPALAVMRMGSQVSSLLIMTEGGLLAVRETVHLREECQLLKVTKGKDKK